mgnify:CR=1 FL=1
MTTPIIADTGGPDGDGALALPPPNGGLDYQGFGSLTVHAKLRLLPPTVTTWGLALIMQAGFPLSSGPSNFAGDPGVMLWPSLAAEWHPVSRFRMDLNVGYRLGLGTAADDLGPHRVERREDHHLREVVLHAVHAEVVLGDDDVGLGRRHQGDAASGGGEPDDQQESGDPFLPASDFRVCHIKYLLASRLLEATSRQCGFKINRINESSLGKDERSASDCVVGLRGIPRQIAVGA